MRRTDALGRAFAGSQLEVQIYVNRRQRELTRAVLAAMPDVVDPDPWLYWVSPLEGSGFHEYRDEDFLRAVGLAHLQPQLAQFWPRRGPVWDALGIVEHASGRGIVLVEAKSHAGELYGSGCRAGPESRLRIEAALDEAKSALGAASDADWTGPLYQYANRLAHLHFLHREGVPAWFVHLLFLDDPSALPTWPPGEVCSSKRIGSWVCRGRCPTRPSFFYRLDPALSSTMPLRCSGSDRRLATHQPAKADGQSVLILVPA